MTKNEKTIVVPWDFTEVSQYALDNSIPIANILKNSITIVHIIEDGGLFSSSSKKQKEIESAEEKLKKIAEENETKCSIKTSVIVREGNIYNTINEIAEEINGNMIIMGTHGMKGMQKITGSKALKVIVGSQIPYIVVQDKYQFRDNNDIVFPVDFRTENKEKLLWASYMAKNFGSKINIFTPKVSDELLKRKTTANLNFAKKFLRERSVNFEIHTAEGKGSFPEEIVKFSKKIDPNVILIMTTKNIGFQDYILGATEQYIIANSAKISVMCVNPRTDLKIVGGFN